MDPVTYKSLLLYVWGITIPTYMKGQEHYVLYIQYDIFIKA